MQPHASVQSAAVSAAPAMAPPACLTHMASSDSTPITLRDWPASPGHSPGATARARIVLVHGLGEHSGRYAALAQQLNGWGFDVRAYDQYGHGLSGGPRGGLSSEMRLLDDLAVVLDATVSEMPKNQPIVLLGHSMGGLVAADFVASGLRHVDGLVLSSPALALPLSGLQKVLIEMLPRVAPHLRVSNGVQSQHLSHDPAVVQAYEDDALQHRRISARLAAYMAGAARQVQAQARHWCVPTLLLWAGQDKLVDPEGSRCFAEHAPRQVVQSQCFEAAYHEIFNETPELAAPVLSRLQQWLDERFPVRAPVC